MPAAAAEAGTQSVALIVADSAASVSAPPLQIQPAATTRWGCRHRERNAVFSRMLMFSLLFSNRPGVWQYDNATAEGAIALAFEAGFRQIDTAEMCVHV